MKKIILLLILVLLSINFAKAQDQMYIMKAGEIKGQHTVTAVDSIIFYAPPAIPVSQIILTSNAESVFAGQNIDLSTFISSIEPATASDKTVTWSSSSSAISISNASTGAATAGAVGTTAVVTVTANDGSLVSNAITFTVTAEAPNPYLSGAIPNAKYIGRWGKDSSGAYDKSHYQGAMIKVKFSGTTAKIELKTGMSWDSSPWYSIDGGPFQLMTPYPSPPYGEPALYNLTPQPLADGVHDLVIVHSDTTAATEDYSIYSAVLVLDNGASTYPPDLSSIHIEFIGDSITCGWGNPNRYFDSYTWLIGDKLGVERTQLSHSGYTLAQMAGLYPKVGKDDGSAWDFSAYETDFVFVNLGENAYVNEDAYYNFLSVIRQKNPNAWILGMALFSDDKNAGSIGPVSNAVARMNDSKVVFHDGKDVGLITGDDFTSQGSSQHPNQTGNLKIANHFGPIIASYLGLTWPGDYIIP